MKLIDLTKQLAKYKKGWVAFNSKHRVIAHADTFKEIANLAEKLKQKVYLFPATGDYSRYIT